VGGIKEKILAAKRAGIKDVILCVENQKDVEEINKEYIKGVKFHYVRNMTEVLEFALMKK
jgi:ATP-dependent Lon protease